MPKRYRASTLFSNLINYDNLFDINGSIWEVVMIDPYNQDMLLGLLKKNDKGDLLKTGVQVMASDIRIEEIEGANFSIERIKGVTK